MTTTPRKTVKDYIRTIADFPHEGILFRDVTTLFADARGFRMAIDQLLHPYAGMRIDKVVGLEARGFILGGAIAHQLTVGFVPIRKKGKLPPPVVDVSYDLEYGSGVLEMQTGQGGLLLIDDVLATGGTLAASVALSRQAGYALAGIGVLLDIGIAPGFRCGEWVPRTVLQYG